MLKITHNDSFASWEPSRLCGNFNTYFKQPGESTIREDYIILVNVYRSC
ncbi:unnamed protein product [Larinioides sclopetarius]|uniref:Uncharacterized protein n=1 Tax=Larinioides sclopetarius TaxID=280406 RepID=A0AAV1Z4Y4_9ARAC